MDFFKQLLVHVYAVLAIVPFIPFLIVWFSVYYWKRNKKKATSVAIIVTTALLLETDYMLFNHLFHSVFGYWLIILLLLIMTGLIGREQNQLRGSIHLPRLLMVLARIGFLVLSFTYIILSLIGIIKYLTVT